MNSNINLVSYCAYLIWSFLEVHFHYNDVSRNVFIDVDTLKALQTFN